MIKSLFCKNVEKNIFDIFGVFLQVNLCYNSIKKIYDYIKFLIILQIFSVSLLGQSSDHLRERQKPGEYSKNNFLRH